MHVQRLYRPTVREALAEARETLGPGALGLATGLVAAPGWGGWMGQRVVRLTAAAERLTSPEITDGDLVGAPVGAPGLQTRGDLMSAERPDVTVGRHLSKLSGPQA